MNWMDERGRGKEEEEERPYCCFEIVFNNGLSKGSIDLINWCRRETRWTIFKNIKNLNLWKNVLDRKCPRPSIARYPSFKRTLPPPPPLPQFQFIFHSSLIQSKISSYPFFSTQPSSSFATPSLTTKMSVTIAAGFCFCRSGLPTQLAFLNILCQK